MEAPSAYLLALLLLRENSFDIWKREGKGEDPTKNKAGGQKEREK